MLPTSSPGLVICLALIPSSALASIMSPSLATLSLLADQDALGRDVAMDDVLLVGGLERLGDVHADRQGEPPVEHLQGAEFSMSLVSGSPSTYSMANQQVIALLAGAVEGDQVGVVQPDSGGHGADEPLDVLFVAGEVGVQDLDGDVLAVAGVAGLVDQCRCGPWPAAGRARNARSSCRSARPRRA